MLVMAMGVAVGRVGGTASPVVMGCGMVVYGSDGVGQATAKGCSGCCSECNGICCTGCMSTAIGGNAVNGRRAAAVAASLHLLFAHHRLFSPRQPEEVLAPQRQHGKPDGDGRRTPGSYVVGMMSAAASFRCERSGLWSGRVFGRPRSGPEGRLSQCGIEGGQFVVSVKGGFSVDLKPSLRPETLPKKASQGCPDTFEHIWYDIS